MPRGIFHQDKSGSKIGMLLLLEKLEAKEQNGSYHYRVRCDCGVEKTVAYSRMVSGNSKSCGCLQHRKGSASPAFKHGRSKKGADGYLQYAREKYDLSKYGLTPEQKTSMLGQQGGCCAVCGYKFGQKKGDMHVDHCHTTGAVRGLLCNECNTGIGLLRESAEIMQSAVKYLNQSALAR
jgi:hypothetical protein